MEDQVITEETITEDPVPVVEEPVIEIPKKRFGASLKKKRGRAKRTVKAKEVASEATLSQEAPKPKRRERIPFGTPVSKLKGPKDPNFVYRYFNDSWMKEPDRVKRAKEAGYEIVDGYDSITVGTNEDGSAIKGVLMRIPKEWYDEDQKAKMRELDKVDAEINRGKFQEKPGDRRYVPTSGINVETKLTP